MRRLGGETIEVDIKIRELLSALQLLDPDGVFVARPLTGGVSSDIYKVETNDGNYCVKFALAKLQVEAEWFAPVERNEAEYRWLKFVASNFPQSAPKLFGHSAELGGFAMEYLSSDEGYLWKAQMLERAPKPNDAKRVARLLGQIHARSTLQAGLKEEFQNQAMFWDLRIEPYLVFTKEKHPSLAAPFARMIDQLKHADIALIHGDVSPKNIIIRQGHPIILDAECATMGDPAFDVAFCLNHLVLKAYHRPEYARTFLAMVRDFWTEYEREISWEPPDALEERVARLLPMLMLARVDGKSPIEYLHETERTQVRALAIRSVEQEHTTIMEQISQLETSEGGIN